MREASATGGADEKKEARSVRVAPPRGAPRRRAAAARLARAFAVGHFGKRSARDAHVLWLKHKPHATVVRTHG